MAVLLAHREAAWAAWAVSIVVRVCCVLAAVFACFFVATEPTWAATVNIGYSQRGATNALSAPFFGANTKRLKPHNILAQLDIGPDALWLVVGTHAWTEIDSAPVGVAHRYKHYGVGMLNQPAGWVLQALNGSQPLPAGTHAVNVQVEIMTYEAIDLMASIDLGRWTPSLRGSFLEPLEWLRFSGHGAAHGSGTDDIPVRMHFHTLHGDAGFGWAFGAGIEYAGDGYRVQVEVIDAVGRLTWHGANVRAGLLDTDQLVLGPDGFPSRKAIAQGRYWREDRQTAPNPRWRLTWHAAEGTLISLRSVELERTEKRIAGMATYRITPGFALRLGINYPPTAYQLGLVWETWRFAILAQPVATGPRSLGITLGRKIKF